MSFHSLKRSFVLAGLLLTAATSLLAGGPSARTGARAAFDEPSSAIVMFGGVTTVDPATAKSYELDETWLWDGTRWIRRYPAHSPAPRYSHMMATDSSRDQIVMFGGRAGTTELSDTWVFRNQDWSPVETQRSPEKRVYGGFAFDAARNVTVLYGGQRLSDDLKSIVNFYDMWEFDGTNWTQRMEKGPEVLRPVLVFDEARNEMLMVGTKSNDALDSVMYRYDAAANAWNEIKPETLPLCFDDASALFVKSSNTVFVAGGACAKEGVGGVDDVYTWDGTNWTKVTTETAITRGVNRAAAYDAARDVVIYFGGAFAFTTVPISITNAFSFGNWSYPTDDSSPGARSLFGIASDPASGIVYMYGGLNDSDFFSDFWKFESGYWQRITAEGGPPCGTPVIAFDTDRHTLVAVCNDSSTYEFDGTAWKTFASLKPVPHYRKFGAMVYDQNIKRTVIYGGYDDINGNYVGKTFTWDGTAWTEQAKKKRPYLRALASMWYDPITKKTLLYGGLGRKNTDARLERFSDMWSFDGKDWTQMKPAATPGVRYGAQLAVNPTTNRTILFGGLRFETDEKGLGKQTYASDTWEWDGTTWRQLQTAGSPTARENAGMAWDAAGSRMILFGGWSGFYNADTWELKADNAWRVFAE